MKLNLKKKGGRKDVFLSEAMQRETQNSKITQNLVIFYFQASSSGFNYSLSGKAALRAACTGSPAWEPH